LISGASPFRGNIELAAGSSIDIDGNDSFGINLANTPMMTEGLTGNLTTAGVIDVTGDRSTGINLAANITGDVTNEGFVVVRGEDSQAIAITGDIDGAFESNGNLSSSGFRFTDRPAFGGDIIEVGREDLTEEDLRQGGSTLSISGDVTDGILLSQRFEPLVNSEGIFVDALNVPIEEGGDPVFTQVGESTIAQIGSAPAVLIDGGGTPIAVGVVADITDPTDPDFNESLQFGFINQGTITASGVFDDVDATAISVANVTFEGGISNTNNLSASTFRAPNPTDLAAGGDGIARRQTRSFLTAKI